MAFDITDRPRPTIIIESEADMHGRGSFLEEFEPIEVTDTEHPLEVAVVSFRNAISSLLERNDLENLLILIAETDETIINESLLKQFFGYPDTRFKIIKNGKKIDLLYEHGWKDEDIAKLETTTLETTTLEIMLAAFNLGNVDKKAKIIKCLKALVEKANVRHVCLGLEKVVTGLTQPAAVESLPRRDNSIRQFLDVLAKKIISDFCPSDFLRAKYHRLFGWVTQERDKYVPFVNSLLIMLGYTREAALFDATVGFAEKGIGESTPSWVSFFITPNRVDTSEFLKR